MLPLCTARIEDLGQGDFVKVDCAACHHVALLAPDSSCGSGSTPQPKVLDLKGRVRCQGCGKRGRAMVSIQVAAPEQMSRIVMLEGTKLKLEPAREAPLPPPRHYEPPNRGRYRSRR
jgi:ribosomal protein S27E